MVNLREKPYYLNDEQIQWVEDTIAGMTIEEKIGQLFVNMVGNEEERKPENIKKVLDTYHPGAIRYHNAPKDVLWDMANCLQESTKIPLLIASNCEQGRETAGVGGGTLIANGAAMAAIDSEDAVYEMATISAREATAVGCNWELRSDRGYPLPTGEIRSFSSVPSMIIRTMQRRSSKG